MSGEPAGTPSPVAGLLTTRGWFTDRAVVAALGVGAEAPVLTVCGAGDVAFALAIAGCRVEAVDVRFAQIAFAELELTAVRQLPVQSVRSLLGLAHFGRRVWFYHFVRPHLGEHARTFWDPHEAAIRLGLADQGAVERRIVALRTRALPLAVRRDVIEAVVAAPTVEAQAEVFQSRWEGFRWHAALRVALAPLGLAVPVGNPRLAGLGPEYPHRIAERVREVFTHHPVGQDPRLRWALTGQLGDLEAGPTWLSTPGHARLLRSADNVRLVHGRLADALREPPAGGWAGFFLGDTLDELSVDAQAELLELVVRAARPGARVVSYRLARPYTRPSVLAGRLVRDEAASAALLAAEVVPAWLGADVEVVAAGG